jgi:hypothetical protein
MKEINKESLLFLLSYGLYVAIGVIAAAVLLCLLSEQEASAQTIPRRVDMLQTVQPLQKPPMFRVDRLRADIIDATNPQTGRVNVRILRQHPGSAEPDLHGVSTGHRILGKHPGSAEPDLHGVSTGHRILRRRN